LGDFLNIGHMDFIATHLCRTSSDCPAQNFSEVQSYIGWMSSLGVRVPVHLQEPMRRGIVKTFNPVAEDYYRDETDAKIVEAAGWCFHNGDNCKYSTDCRPFRSFTMTDADGRLFDQLDSVEQTTATGLMGQIGSTDVNVRRYQAEYAEQLSHAVGRQDGLAWTASVSADAAGLMTSGPLLDGVPAGDHLVEWRLKINNNTSDNDGMVTLTVRGGGAPLASLTVNRQDFTAANTYQTFPLTFTSTGQQDLEFRTNWLDKADMWCDWIQLTIGGGNLSPPVIAEVSPDPDIARPGTPYIRTLALLQGTPAPTWLVVQGPAGTQVNTSGVVSGWTPTLADLGTLVTFEIRAANSQGSDTETWQVLVRSAADFDGDGDVDQADFGLLQACFTPMGGPLPAGCEHVNLDGDPDIDQDDFNLFMPCVGGPNAPPGC
jgi:hypothetical protein